MIARLLELDAKPRRDTRGPAEAWTIARDGRRGAYAVYYARATADAAAAHLRRTVPGSDFEVVEEGRW